MKTLKQYQEDAVLACIESDRHVLAELPTGSGKSLIGAVTACMLVKSGKRVVIATTQENIERSFSSCGKVRSSFGTVDCSGMILSRSSAASGSAVLEHLRSGVGVMVTTHATLARIDCSEGESDFAGAVVVLDEAHHAGLDMTKLGAFIQYCGAHSCRVVSLTATAYRSDCSEILLDGADTFVRTLSQHMAEGECPGHVDVDWLPYCVSDVTDSLFFGEAGSASQLGSDQVLALAELMVSTWVKTGMPKVVIRVPSMPSGAMITVQRICDRFAKAGARVLNASGDCALDGRPVDLFSTLEDERSVGYRKSGIDVIVGCNRVMEGLDWPHCSDVYCVGVPSSVRTISQLLGRAMRKKADDHPSRSKDRSAIRFFLPTKSAYGFDGLNQKQAFHVLLMCAMIEDSTNAALWCSLDGKSRRVQTVPCSDPKLRQPVSDETRDRVRVAAYYQLACKAIIEGGGQLTQRTIREWMLAPAFDLDRMMVNEFLDSRTIGGSVSIASVNGVPDGFSVIGVESLASEFDSAARVGGTVFRSLVLRLTSSLIGDYGTRMKMLADPVLPQMSLLEKLSRRMRRKSARGRAVVDSR